MNYITQGYGGWDSRWCYAKKFYWPNLCAAITDPKSLYKKEPGTHLVYF